MPKYPYYVSYCCNFRTYIIDSVHIYYHCFVLFANGYGIVPQLIEYKYILDGVVVRRSSSKNCCSNWSNITLFIMIIENFRSNWELVYNIQILSLLHMTVRLSEVLLLLALFLCLVYMLLLSNLCYLYWLRWRWREIER